MKDEQARDEAREPKPLHVLRGMTDDKLVTAHDAVIAAPGLVGQDYYLAELARRAADRQTTTMVRLTWVIAALTVVNVVAVVYSIA
jgi:hypothetical protein